MIAMISAFGVEHGEFSKASQTKPSPPPSGGRRAMAYFGGPLHGMVAGKKGKKLRSAGNEYGGALGGAIGGSIVGGGLGTGIGHLASKGSPVGTRAGLAVGHSLGTLAGGIAGSQAGLARNTRKGYLRKEPR